MKNSRINIILTILAILPVLVVTLGPAIYSFKWLVDYSVQVMFAYLIAGLLLLFFSKIYWVTISWGCCVLLCIFLKYTSNEALSFEVSGGGQVIKVANYNISFVEDSIENFIQSIKSNDANLVSIQEVTPDIDTLFKQELKSKYPYCYSLKRADYFGMMVFSNYPFEKIDTFNFGKAPNIDGVLKIESSKKRFKFILSYCPPSFSNSTYSQLKGHLKAIAARAAIDDTPAITMGNYNTVPWAPEIQDFKKIAQLTDSRLGLTPTTASSTNPLFQIPIDHIFYSHRLRCTNFKALSYGQHNHLGVEGTFEIK